MSVLWFADENKLPLHKGAVNRSGGTVPFLASDSQGGRYIADN